SSDNVILLRWGWRAPERTEDPFARQFRVYLAPTFDLIPGEILSATEVAPGDWQLAVRVPRALDANAAAGLFLNARYPFFIGEHTAGPLLTMRVRARIPDATGAFRRPALGTVGVPLRLAPAMTRPASWNERFVFPSGHAFLSITEAERYEAVIRDRLLLTPEHPRDALWVGVTAADGESYVDDTFPAPGPDGPLPGNESPTVVVLCQARRAVRPEFDPPPPAGPVPRVRAPEPAGGPVHFRLDLTPFLTGSGLAAGPPAQPPRPPGAGLSPPPPGTGNQR